MHRRHAGLLALSMLLTLLTSPSVRPLAEETDGTLTIAERTAGLEPRAGLLVTYVDPRRGKLWLELPAPCW